MPGPNPRETHVHLYKGKGSQMQSTFEIPHFTSLPIANVSVGDQMLTCNSVLKMTQHLINKHNEFSWFIFDMPYKACTDLCTALNKIYIFSISMQIYLKLIPTIAQLEI